MATPDLPLPADLLVPPSPPQQPRAERTTTILLIAKLELASGKEALCRLRNLSATGMLLETGEALLPGDRVVVELRTRDRLSATVVWTDSPRAGLQLDEEIDVAATLQPRTDRKAEAARAPRFTVAAPGRISGLGRAWPVTINNLSQSGARVSPCCDIPVGIPITLAIAGLAPRACYVRWRDDQHIGVAFIELISYAELSVWLSSAPRLN